MCGRSRNESKSFATSIESGEARSCQFALAVALEQLSVVSEPRGRSGQSQRHRNSGDDHTTEMMEQNMNWGAPCLAGFARHGNHGVVFSSAPDIPSSRNFSETWGTHC